MNLTELMKTRRTHRKFKQIPVSDDDLSIILQAQQYASCSRNAQNLRYVAIRDSSLIASIFPYTHWAALLPEEQGAPTEDEKPTLFLLVLDSVPGKNPRAELNAGLAISNMTIAAWELGIGSCILGNFSRAKVKEILNIPDNMALMYLIAFGYPIDESRISVTDITCSTDYYLESPNHLVIPKYKINDIVSYR